MPLRLSADVTQRLLTHALTDLLVRDFNRLFKRTPNPVKLLALNLTREFPLSECIFVYLYDARAIRALFRDQHFVSARR